MRIPRHRSLGSSIPQHCLRLGRSVDSLFGKLSSIPIFIHAEYCLIRMRNSGEVKSIVKERGVCSAKDINISVLTENLGMVSIVWFLVRVPPVAVMLIY